MATFSSLKQKENNGRLGVLSGGASVLSKRGTKRGIFANRKHSEFRLPSTHNLVRFLEKAMDCCMFLEARPMAGADGVAAAIDVQALHQAIATRLAEVPGLRKVIVHTPVADGANDPYLHKETPPACTLQWYFDDLDRLEAASQGDGPIAAVLKQAERFGLAGHTWVQQSMAVRRYPVPEPVGADPAADARNRCTYMVSYEGPADDMNAWLRHYIDSHPPIMKRFPGIREIEIYSRMDVCNTLPAPFVAAMQRNKVVFDSPAALDAALASPVRHEMRADFKAFPPYQGANFHYPMHSVTREYDRGI